jgi:hypothetical protein
MACGKVWIKGSSTDAYIESLVKAAPLDDSVIRAMHGEPNSAPAEHATSAMQARYRELREFVLEREKAVLDGQLEERFGVSMDSYRRWRAERQAELDRLQHELSRAADGADAQGGERSDPQLGRGRPGPATGADPPADAEYPRSGGPLDSLVSTALDSESHEVTLARGTVHSTDATFWATTASRASGRLCARRSRR